MDSDKKKILIVDDNDSLIYLLKVSLEDNYDVNCIGSGRDSIKTIGDFKPDLVLLDMKLPDISGFEVLAEIRSRGLKTVVIMMTAFGDINLAVQAIKLGADDFIQKPFTDDVLNGHIEKLLSIQAKPKEQYFIRNKVVGESQKMQSMWEDIDKFCPTDINILIEGQTGTGKELIARSIHEMSKFSKGPFVPLDCTSFPDTIIESEIFGYEKGAFTGADTTKPGKFQLAQGGTLFLDEVSNLSLETQAKLLRVIEEKKVYPLGFKERMPIDLNCRIVSASNIKLKDMIEKGLFRPDLYYRLSAVVIDVPALNERGDDIRELAKYFAGIYSEKFERDVLTVSTEALDCLSGYDWPGNVRELENVMKFAVINCEGEQIHLNDLPIDTVKIGNEKASGSCVSSDWNSGRVQNLEVKLNIPEDESSRCVDLKKISAEVSEMVELEIIRSYLSNKNLNRSQMAKLFNLDAKTLRSKIRKIEEG